MTFNSNFDQALAPLNWFDTDLVDSNWFSPSITSYDTGWTYTGSGGGLSGGAAQVNIARVYVGGGGASSDGSAEYARVLTYTTSGGGVSGGGAALALVYVSGSSGGGVSGGAAGYQAIRLYVGSGGALSSGGATERIAKVCLGTGGGISAGTAQVTRVANFVGIGGGTSGGTGAVMVLFVYISSGSGTSGGAVDDRFLRYIERPLQYAGISTQNNVAVVLQDQYVVVSTGSLIVPVQHGNTIDITSMTNQIQVVETNRDSTSIHRLGPYLVVSSENDIRPSTFTNCVIVTEQNKTVLIVSHNSLIVKDQE